MFTPISPSVAFFKLRSSVFFRSRYIRVETLLLVSGSNQIAISNEQDGPQSTASCLLQLPAPAVAAGADVVAAVCRSEVPSDSVALHAGALISDGQASLRVMTMRVAEGHIL